MKTNDVMHLLPPDMEEPPATRFDAAVAVVDEAPTDPPTMPPTPNPPNPPNPLAS